MNKDDLENHVNEMVNKLFGPNFVVVKEKKSVNCIL